MSMEVEQHFVTFQSPGTFVPETDTIEIDSWDVGYAVERAGRIFQRYGARPFGFRFTTRGREKGALDSKEIAKSNFYWLGGKVETLAEIEARNDPKEEVLRHNMRGNGYDKIVINNNSYRYTAPLSDGDIILDVTLPPLPEKTP